MLNKKFLKQIIVFSCSLFILSACNNESIEPDDNSNIYEITTCEISDNKFEHSYNTITVAGKEETTSNNDSEEKTNNATAISSQTDTVYGLDGDLIELEQTTFTRFENKIYFEGFTFFREATGNSFNDETFKNYDMAWNKVEVGDMFNTLVVRKAISCYSSDEKKYENATDLSNDDAKWCERLLEFDGELILDGLLTVNLNEDENNSKCLFFQADPDSLVDRSFPMLKAISFSWNRDISPYGNNVFPVDDTEVFVLGNIEQYNEIFDWSQYSNEHNHINIHATVKLSDISIYYTIYTSSTPCGITRAKLSNVLNIYD